MEIFSVCLFLPFVPAERRSYLEDILRWRFHFGDTTMEPP